MTNPPDDPIIKRLFPWSLFLVLAALLMMASCVIEARSSEIDPSPPKPSYADWTCEKLKAYLSTHSEAEARAKAAEMHLPKWLVRKAEKCVP